MRSAGNVYFISDLHLGVAAKTSSEIRERLFVKWLQTYGEDMKELYIVGDLFDFWFEYKKSVPRGFTRAIGSLALLADKGVKIHLFTGNHDLWIFDYLPQEIGCQLYREPVVRMLSDKKFYIGHGDGLGPGDHGYKFLKKIFTNPLAQWLFRHLHPDIGIRLAQGSSKASRKHTGGADAVFESKEKEWLYQYCLEVLSKEDVDVFVFGHRHLPLDLQVGTKSRYVNLGDWLYYQTYAVWNGNDLELRSFEADTQFIKS